MKLTDVSVVVTSRNDEDDIRRCLDSVRGFGETVVLDSFSTDGTMDIAREHPVTVYTLPSQSAADRCNWAMSRVSRPWVLALGANESVSAAMRDEIARADDSVADGFRFHRVSAYLGKTIRCAPRRERTPLRLFRSSRGRFVGRGAVCEVVLDGREETAVGPLFHSMYLDVHRHLDAINGETTVAAREYVDSGGWPAAVLALPRMLFGPPLLFFNRYFLHMGIWDGARGLIYCLLTAYASFITHAKSWEYRRRKKGAAKEKGGGQ